MKIFNLIAGSILIGLLASCSAASKTDQTVDDVYYSPGRSAGGDVATTKNKDANDEYAYNKEEDNYLRMKVQNPTRWNSIDDYAYWNSYNTTYYGLNTFGYTSLYNNYWNSYYYNPYISTGLYSGYYGYGFGYSYNPYAYYSYNNGYNYYNPGVYYKTASSNAGPRPNLGAYQNHTFSNQNFSNQNYSNHNSNYVNGNTQPQTGVGRLLRTIVTGGNQNTTTPTYNPARTFSSPSTNTYTPSSSSSSSSSSSAGSSRTSGTGGGRRN